MPRPRSAFLSVDTFKSIRVRAGDGTRGADGACFGEHRQGVGTFALPLPEDAAAVDMEWGVRMYRLPQCHNAKGGEPLAVLRGDRFQVLTTALRWTCHLGERAAVNSLSLGQDR